MIHGYHAQTASVRLEWELLMKSSIGPNTNFETSDAECKLAYSWGIKTRENYNWMLLEFYYFIPVSFHQTDFSILKVSVHCNPRKSVPVWPSNCNKRFIKPESWLLSGWEIFHFPIKCFLDTCNNIQWPYKIIILKSAYSTLIDFVFNLQLPWWG